MRNICLLWDDFVFLTNSHSKSIPRVSLNTLFSNNLERAHLSTTFWDLALQMTCLEIHFGWGVYGKPHFPWDPRRPKSSKYPVRRCLEPGCLRVQILILTRCLDDYLEDNSS